MNKFISKLTITRSQLPKINYFRLCLIAIVPACFRLVRLKNEGVLRRLLLTTWPPRIPNVQTSWVRVTLSDISPILYMFGLGVILGVIFLTAERIHKKINKSKIPSMHSANQLLDNMKSDFNATTDHWKTRYTDWTQASLHYRGKEKGKHF